MKPFGSILMIGSGFLLFWAMFIFDTSVAAGEFGRVNNLGLMEDKRNYIILGVGAFIVGLLFFLLNRDAADGVSAVGEESLSFRDDGAESWGGVRDLNDDGYKIYLVKKYNIEKNSALEKFIANGKLYENIDAALAAVNDVESASLRGGKNKGLAITALKLSVEIEKEVLQISSRLEKYKYKVLGYDEGRGVWEVACSTGKFDQNLTQLRELLRNFEK